MNITEGQDSLLARLLLSLRLLKESSACNDIEFLEIQGENRF